MANNDVRDNARNKNVPLWAVAASLKVSEATLTRKLRFELSDEEKQRILDIIDDLKEVK